LKPEDCGKLKVAAARGRFSCFQLGALALIITHYYYYEKVIIHFTYIVGDNFSYN
jgi:hypothetical protein